MAWERWASPVAAHVTRNAVCREGVDAIPRDVQPPALPQPGGVRALCWTRDMIPNCAVHRAQRAGGTRR